MNIQDWTLYYDNFGPLSCQAPCTMYSVLYDHGKIPDPFYGTNERELQYLAEKDCVFESVFSAPPALLTREHIELVFHGLDTICHIYLNGTLLGKVKNMHREYVYEVKPLLTAGENTLRLEFKSPLALLRPTAAQALPVHERRRHPSRRRPSAQGHVPVRLGLGSFP